MPAHRIAIGLWNYDTTDANNLRRSLVDRVNSLATAIGETSNYFTSQGLATSLDPRILFDTIVVAPEYFFTAVSDQNKRRPIPEKPRLVLEKLLLARSRLSPRTLIIPGTVFHAKALVRPVDAAQAKFGPDGTRSQPKVSEADRRQRSLRKVDAAATAVELWQGKYDVLEEITLVGMTGINSRRVPSLVEASSAIEPAANKNPLIVRNAAYLLLAGKRFAKYDKQSDWFETDSASPDDMVFVPGTSEQCPMIGGYRFGVEICYDHTNSMLSRRNPPKLHFHVVLSDYTTNKVNSMAMCAGGYFLHASTVTSETALYYCDKNSLKTQVAPNSSVDVAGGNLFLFDRELPAL